jgi:hypothetical protein
MISSPCQFELPLEMVPLTELELRAFELQEQAKPTLCTQILYYNPSSKHYNSKYLYLQYRGMLFIWFAKLRGFALNFRAWEWWWACCECGG